VAAPIQLVAPRLEVEEDSLDDVAVGEQREDDHRSVASRAAQSMSSVLDHDGLSWWMGHASTSVADCCRSRSISRGGPGARGSAQRRGAAHPEER
jgi:hypothetical protein